MRQPVKVRASRSRGGMSHKPLAHERVFHCVEQHVTVARRLQGMRNGPTAAAQSTVINLTGK
jgi:hypothetical protein